MVERIILHAGTPKTGTTSLQIVLDQYREVLAQRGLLYPRAMVAPGAAANRSYNVKPKHQWLVDDLMADNPARFADDIASVLGQMPSNINTLVLSTEGLFNHWWDFTINGRAAGCYGRVSSREIIDYQAREIAVLVWKSEGFT